MTELVQQILVAFIPAVITAIVTALLTIRLSIPQFQSRRWWEKKAETYSTILEHLSELQFILGRYWDELTGVAHVGPEEGKRLMDIYREARVAIGKAEAVQAVL